MSFISWILIYTCVPKEYPTLTSAKLFKELISDLEKFKSAIADYTEYAKNYVDNKDLSSDSDRDTSSDSEQPKAIVPQDLNSFIKQIQSLTGPLTHRKIKTKEARQQLKTISNQLRFCAGFFPTTPLPCSSQHDGEIVVTVKYDIKRKHK